MRFRLVILACLFAPLHLSQAEDAWRIGQFLPALQPTAPGIARARIDAPIRTAALREYARISWPLARARDYGADLNAEACDLLGEELVRSAGLPGRMSGYRLRRRLEQLAEKTQDPVVLGISCTWISIDSTQEATFYSLESAIHKIPSACPAWWHLRIIDQYWHWCDSFAADNQIDWQKSVDADAIAMLTSLGTEPRILDRERFESALLSLSTDVLADGFKNPDPASPLGHALARCDPWTIDLLKAYVQQHALIEAGEQAGIEPMPGSQVSARPMLPEYQRLAAARPENPWPGYLSVGIAKWIDPSPDGSGLNRISSRMSRADVPIYTFNGFPDWQAHQAGFLPFMQLAMAADPTFPLTMPAASEWAGLEMFPAMGLMMAATASQAWDLGIPQTGRFWAGQRVLGRARAGHMWTNNVWRTALTESINGQLAWATGSGKPSAVSDTKVSPEQAVAARTLALAAGWQWNDRALQTQALSAGVTGVSAMDWPPRLTLATFATALADAQRRLGAPSPPEPQVAAIPMRQAWRAAMTELLAQAGPADPAARAGLLEVFSWWLWEESTTVTSAQVAHWQAAEAHALFAVALAYFAGDDDAATKAANQAWKLSAKSPPLIRWLVGHELMRHVSNNHPPSIEDVAGEMQRVFLTLAHAPSCSASTRTLLLPMLLLPNEDAMGRDDLLGYQAGLAELARHPDWEPWQACLVRAARGLIAARNGRIWNCPDWDSDVATDQDPGPAAEHARHELDEAWHLAPGQPVIAIMAINGLADLSYDEELVARWTQRLLITNHESGIIAVTLSNALNGRLGREQPPPWMIAIRTCAAAGPESGGRRAALRLVRSALHSCKADQDCWHQSDLGDALEKVGTQIVSEKPADVVDVRYELLSIAWLCQRPAWGRQLAHDIGTLEPARVVSALGATPEVLTAWLAQHLPIPPTLPVEAAPELPPKTNF